MHDNDFLSWEELAIKAINLSKEDITSAQKTFQKSLALNPDRSWPYIKYADIVDDYDTKRSLLQQAINIDDNLWGYIGLIDIFTHRQEQDQALKTLGILRKKIKNIKKIDDECIISKYLELESTLNPNQHHLLVKYGIDFSQNVTSTSDIENFWPIHHDYTNKINKYNAIGKLYAKQYSIAIVGTITEADPKNVEHLVQQLVLVGQLFKNARIALINHSINSKVQEILNNNHINTIDHSQYNIPNNAYVDWVKKECPQSDYVLVIDLDFIQSFSINGIMNSIFWLQRIHKAAAMGSYSLGITNSIKNRLAKNIDIHSLKLEDYYNYNKDWISSLYLKVGSKPFCVKSCFGGLILYKTEAFLLGEYHADDNQHVLFHHSLAKKNKQLYKIYLNPTSRTCNILTDNYVHINNLKILDTHQDNTGLGLVNKDLHKWCLTHGHLINKFNNKDILLIAGRPDEYTLLDNFPNHYRVFWTTFESTMLPPSWVSYLNKVDEVIVPHESICQNFINSGVTSQISIVEQPYQRYNRKQSRSKSDHPEKILNIGFNGLPTNRKNLVKLIQAIKKLNYNNKKYHLYIKMPYLFNNSYEHLLDSNITLDIGDFSSEQMMDWYSKLDAYIYPSSGEGWSFTPRESLYMGIPTVITDIGVHQELLPYCCVINNDNTKELAYYEFCQAFHGQQNHYSIENIVDALNDLYANYSKYRDLAANGSKWISTMWTQNELYNKLLDTLEPENLIICPSQHKLCGINTYTQKLLPCMKNTKYISKIDDIIKYDLTKIKNIHVQHEWGLYDHQKLINTIKSLPDNINKQITLHSVIRDNPEHQQEIIDTFDEVYSLCSRSISIDPRIKYTKHGADLPLYCGDKNLVKLNKESRTIGTFGFLHPNKGYEYVAKALEDLNFNYKIVATHKGSEESIILENNLKNKPNVILDTNVYDMYMIYKIMLDCKALVFYYHEDNLFFTSGAVLEAGRFGLPIITSDECMFDDLGDAVCRVEKKNTDSLISAIAKLSDTNYCQTLVNNMNKLLSERDWKVCSKQYYHN